ncbi:MAG: alpha/beta fold hydrolase [Firmicutes bacterium]|jgi:pimeloyl-ACP methyl ester carboxylesterase|nr:alpha/beta fold hydrolase [Bacillota bacterium]MDD4337684.1 alpha/beta fold hydrolase [Bacillota bacterium]MDD4792965.1 alpha/beta fold hydrolase [Bacillota bacterium]
MNKRCGTRHSLIRLVRVGALAVLMLIAVACGICSGPAGAYTSGIDSGKFNIYAGGALMGTEDFEVSADEAKCTVELHVGGGVTRLDTVLGLAGELGASSYVLDAGPGGTLSVTFEEHTAHLSLPGMGREFQLGMPRVVMDNNVFCHYQVLIGMYDARRGGVQTFQALVPSALAAASFAVEHVGATEKTASSPIPLSEYRVVIEKAIGVSVLVDEGGRVMHLEIPGQGVLAVRQEFEELMERASQEAEPPAAPAGAASLVERDFTVRSGSDVVLAGTLTLPAGAQSPYPAVVLISGSGPQDRDGNTPPVYVANIFRTIAHRLADVGVATLRYDERGVGESTGHHESANLHDLIGDVSAMIDYLRELPEIDHSRIGLIGHSEGAYIAPYLASRDSRFAGCILLAGASITIDELMIEQIEYQAEFEELDEASRALARSLAPAVRQFVEDARAGKDSSVLPGNLEWVRQHMELDPIENIRKVNAPILIVQGEKDLKVMPYHADVLARAAQERGNRDISVVRLANTTHEFLQFPYNNPNFDPMDPMNVVDELFDAICDWSERVLAKKH